MNTSWIQRSARRWWAPILAIGVIAPGCGRGSASDPSQAANLLKMGLEAWRDGKSPEEIRSKVEVVDQRWASGVKLENFDIGESAPQGTDVRCEATLVFVDANGQKRQETAAYTVSVSPPMVVYGADGW
jgi:hypothetical protein